MALEHFYGPGDDKSKFISWVIDQIIIQAENVPLTGGEQTRDFSYVTDVVSAFIAVINQIGKMSAGFHSFEVGSGESVSIKNLVLMISKHCSPHKTHFNFGALPYRANELMESTVNTQPLLSLGWSPKVKLEQGLFQTIVEERALRNMK